MEPFKLGMRACDVRIDARPPWSGPQQFKPCFWVATAIVNRWLRFN